MEKPANKSVEVLTEIADALKESGPEVRERIINTRVEREMGNRVDWIDKLLLERDKAAKALKKIDKPDTELFEDGDGKVARPVYSKQRVEELKKARDKLARIDKAIELGLTQNDYSKAKELLK